MWRAVLAAALLVGVAMTASTARAQTGGGTVWIGSGAAAIGETAYVNVLASDVPAPGVGAYAITIHFDSSVIQMTACAVDPNSACEQPDEGTLIISAASTENLSGEWVIAGITFRCAGRGASPLTVGINSWGSAIPETATPQPAIENGSIQCGSGRISGTLSVQSATGVVGEPVAVNIVVSDLPEPGLGAWTVDPVYDPSKVHPVGCSPTLGGVCSMSYASNEGRFTGASVTGVTGTFSLGSVSFKCLVPGTSAITLTTNVFADATPGSPQNIDVQIQNGTVTCLKELPTAAPTATPQPTAAALPPSGGGASRSQPVAPWLPVALVSIGAGAIVFGEAWRRRLS
jgi:hypothetical protein